MCCLFGILDYKQNLTIWQKNHLLRKLSIACEKRGTDATGIAYNHKGRLEIHKKPVPAHNFHQRIPYGVNVVLGHTRLTTQGNEKINRIKACRMICSRIVSFWRNWKSSEKFWWNKGKGNGKSS